MTARSIESEGEPKVGGDGPAPVWGRVVGIDPGLNVTGYAVVDPGPRGPIVVEAGVIRPGSSDRALGQRLEHLYQNVLELLAAYPPGALALEKVHSHAKFPRTAILMGHARGVIMLAAATKGIPVFGYAAARVKKTLTGSGRAPKDQMQRAIQTELGLAEVPEPHDVADACAIALCHYQIGRALRG
ncbi:crossover junction endodeoxyribonuclease RuvC [Paludisphaera rhizosphaerae]|uniref:crossover junction endodeoxyribonuclease RuvC n=1 Tax=Paludisphaera rhizosphaerae TaxID=2711216 RepID=UPI0013EA920D|nr:crossover junction endodeoxyribonuclease RuvC [Paludisphaera rhizosphaerae]